MQTHGRACLRLRAPRAWARESEAPGARGRPSTSEGRGHTVEVLTGRRVAHARMQRVHARHGEADAVHGVRGRLEVHARGAARPAGAPEPRERQPDSRSRSRTATPLAARHNLRLTAGTPTTSTAAGTPYAHAEGPRVVGATGRAGGTSLWAAGGGGGAAARPAEEQRAGLAQAEARGTAATADKLKLVILLR